MKFSGRNILIFFGGLAMLMLVTNPAKQVYVDNTLRNHDIVFESSRYLCASKFQSVTLPNEYPLYQCALQLSEEKTAVKQLLDVNTQRINLLLVSYYITTVPSFDVRYLSGVSETASRQHFDLGILGNFTGEVGIRYVAPPIFIVFGSGFVISILIVVQTLQSQKNP